MGELPQSSGGVRKLTEMYQQLITQESVAPRPKTLPKQKSSVREPVVALHSPEMLASLGKSLSKENVSPHDNNSLAPDPPDGDATPTGPSTPVEDQSSPIKVPEAKSSTRAKKMSDWSSIRARSTSESSTIVSPPTASEAIDLAYRKLSNPRLSIPKIGEENSSRLGLSDMFDDSPGGLPRRSHTESDKRRAETVAGPLSSKFGSSTFYAPQLPSHVRASRKHSRGSQANPESKAISDLANVIGGSQLLSGGLAVKRNESVRRPRSRSPLRHPDYYQNEDHEEQRSVADLISAYQGQSEARRKTILATCSFSVDIPKQNADKYISRRDSFSLESSQKIPEHDSDLGMSCDPESHAIEAPQEPQILTISVLPNSGEADAPQEHVQRSPQPPRPQKPSWAGQPNVQSSGILNEISDKERKIQEAMYEVISNEQMFYKSMDIVVNHFYHSLNVKFSSETHPQFAQPLNLIFKNADKFLEISDKLLGEIDEKQADKVLVEPYFDILVKIMSTIMLKPFKRYSVMKHQQEQELENCRKDPEFAYYLDTLNMNPCTGGLTLDAFLLKPVQHATRYSLLMDAVVKRLEESDPRYKAAKRAHNEAKSFAEMINSETNLMEFLFELTTVLAGLRDIPAQKKAEVDLILSEAKKGTDIKMYGREISFGRTRRGGINFKHTEKLTIFCWGSYVLITRASEQHGHYHFLSLTDSIEASDGLDIMTELQIGSFPRGLDLSKLLLLKYFPVATTLTVERGSCAMHLLYCTSATKKKWKETIVNLNSSDD